MKKIKLPIDSFQDQILESINRNPVTVVVAETGAGKSTRVPQLILKHSDYQIVVTQPRRVAAKAVAKRVAEEMNCRFGGLVGFRTAVDRNDSSQTRCLFATDGLQLVRELTSAKASIGKGICLVIDEVHEWNLNIEILIAWAKRHLMSGADIKVVLMSATLDYERLSKFFDDAPVIQVPGRCYPVLGSPAHVDGIIQKDAGSMLEEIKRLVSEGANSLVFLPGKGEIKQMENTLKENDVKAVIIPLHGDVLPEEQELAFRSFSKPKVVLATNIAQTSLTIPDIDAVVDSGLERRIELINSVETLLLSNISQADCRQRAGRAGRVKEGQYVLCNDTDYDYFYDYPVPEIKRSLLDQMVLRLAGVGLDALDLPFYHQPAKETLVDAKGFLIAMEALDCNGGITKLGRKINRFPVNVISARMILEALERKCLAPVLTIVAVMSTRYGSIRRRKRNNDPVEWVSWEELLDPTKEYQSDLLVEHDLFNIARAMMDKKWIISHGIDPKGFAMAMEIKRQIKTAIRKLGYKDKDYSRNKTNEEEILKCIASGMLVHLYRHTGGGEYENGEMRQLDRNSIIQNLAGYPEWIVADPININIINRAGRSQTIRLVKNCTKVNPMWFLEIAPHLIEQKQENLRFDSETGSVVEDHVVIFNEIEISREKKIAAYSDKALEIFVISLTNKYFPKDNPWREIKDANEADWFRYREIRKRSGNKIEELDSSFLQNYYYNKIKKEALRLKISEISFHVLEVIMGLNSLLFPLESYLSIDEQEKIFRENPETINISGRDIPVGYDDEPIISIDKDFVKELNISQITLPGGRDVLVRCGNFFGSISDVRLKIDEHIKENFRVEISQHVKVPKEAPFMVYNWDWDITAIGKVLEEQFQELISKSTNRLTGDNYKETLEQAIAEAEIIKQNILLDYEKAKKNLETSKSRLISLSEEDQESEDASIDYAWNLINQAEIFLDKADFASVKKYCYQVAVEIKKSSTATQSNTDMAEALRRAGLVN